MCCIIYKPKGVQMPSLDILSKIKKLNHNGYGFVSTNHFHKGLDYRTFLRHLSEVGDDEDCIIHFRLATHGSICRANCHPFAENGVYFAHNGTLNVLPRWGHDRQRNCLQNENLPRNTAVWIWNKAGRLGYKADLRLLKVCHDVPGRSEIIW